MKLDKKINYQSNLNLKNSLKFKQKNIKYIVFFIFVFSFINIILFRNKI